MVMLFLAFTPLTRSLPLVDAPLYQAMVLRALARPPALQVKRMDVNTSIDPGAAPWRAVDDHRVAAPVKPRRAPTPRTECRADGDTEAEADRSAYKKPRPGSRKHDQRVIIRHTDKRRIHRHD